MGDWRGGIVIAEKLGWIEVKSGKLGWGGEYCI